MSNKIPRVITNNLDFLKLTKVGKIRLTIFADKAIWSAINNWYLCKNNEHPYSAFFALCLIKSHELNYPVQWDMTVAHEMEDPALFNRNESSVTLEGELFDLQVCHTIEKNLMEVLKKKTYQRKQTIEPRQNAYRSYGTTFNQGVTYWKFGEEYKYPDQAIDKNSNPCSRENNSKPILSHTISDEQRADIDSANELKKAIRSGRINPKGLAFLRDTFLKRPAILKVIDDFLYGNFTPDDKQSNLL